MKTKTIFVLHHMANFTNFNILSQYLFRSTDTCYKTTNTSSEFVYQYTDI